MTATTTAGAAAASVQRGENAITTHGTVAVLPPALLWAASQAASSDAAKGVICSVDVRRTADGRIRIAATDGHRCFRVVFPQSEQFWISAEQLEPIRLNPKAFSKAPTRKAAHVSLDSVGVASFTDQLNRPVDAAAWFADTHANAVGQTYPNVDQLWPERSGLACNPGALIGFNAGYVADFCKVAGKLSTNGVVRLLSGKAPTTPVVWEAVLDLQWLLCEPKGSRWCPVFDHPEVVLEYLLMPVQIRG